MMLSLAELRHRLAVSDSPSARFLKGVYRGVQNVSVPAPRLITWPLLVVYRTGRGTVEFLRRKLLAEPLFKACCTSYGHNLRTGYIVPQVYGAGEIVLGNNVSFDGRLGVMFAARFSVRPRLVIGDNTSIGDSCSFIIGREITVGSHCMIAAGTYIADSNGHSVDPARRLAGLPPLPEEVRPVRIEDNVWIGARSTILPGVTIGEGSVISFGSIVRRSVPPYSLVGGNPAKVLARLPRPASKAADENPADVAGAPWTKGPLVDPAAPEVKPSAI